MTIEDGLILKNNKIVIPESLQQEMGKHIHDGHIGVKNISAKQDQQYIGLPWLKILKQQKVM